MHLPGRPTATLSTRCRPCRPAGPTADRACHQLHREEGLNLGAVLADLGCALGDLFHHLCGRGVVKVRRVDAALLRSGQQVVDVVGERLPVPVLTGRPDRWCGLWGSAKYITRTSAGCTCSASASWPATESPPPQRVLPDLERVYLPPLHCCLIPWIPIKVAIHTELRGWYTCAPRRRQHPQPSLRSPRPAPAARVTQAATTCAPPDDYRNSQPADPCPLLHPRTALTTNVCGPDDSTVTPDRESSSTTSKPSPRRPSPAAVETPLSSPSPTEPDCSRTAPPRSDHGQDPPGRPRRPADPPG